MATAALQIDMPTDTGSYSRLPVMGPSLAMPPEEVCIFFELIWVWLVVLEKCYKVPLFIVGDCLFCRTKT